MSDFILTYIFVSTPWRHGDQTVHAFDVTVTVVYLVGPVRGRCTATTRSHDSALLCKATRYLARFGCIETKANNCFLPPVFTDILSFEIEYYGQPYLID